jgi:hypothetical protein
VSGAADFSSAIDALSFTTATIFPCSGKKSAVFALAVVVGDAADFSSAFDPYSSARLSLHHLLAAASSTQPISQAQSSYTLSHTPWCCHL